MNVDQAIEYLSANNINVKRTKHGFVGANIIQERRTGFSVRRKGVRWCLHAMIVGQRNVWFDSTSLKDVADKLISFKPIVMEEHVKAVERRVRFRSKAAFRKSEELSK